MSKLALLTPKSLAEIMRRQLDNLPSRFKAYSEVRSAYKLLDDIPPDFTAEQAILIGRSLLVNFPPDLTTKEIVSFIENGETSEKMEKWWQLAKDELRQEMRYKLQSGLAYFVNAFFTGPLLYGFVFVTLWEWFLVDSHAVESLAYHQGVGIILLANLLLFGVKKGEWRDTSYQQRFYRILLTPFLLSSFMLGAGWILSSFLT